MGFTFDNTVLMDWLGPGGTACLLIALAEIGDKSQLVCMTLAARHRRTVPILTGTVSAFALLNGLAVIFGAALAAWLPETLILAVAAGLFALFGIKAWRDGGEDDQVEADIPSGRGLAMTAFMLIFVAELGDKTQFTVAAMAGIYPPWPIWTGATLALGLTSWLGVVAGKSLLARLPMAVLNRLTGVLFLAIAGFALWRLTTSI